MRRLPPADRIVGNLLRAARNLSIFFLLFFVRNVSSVFLSLLHRSSFTCVTLLRFLVLNIFFFFEMLNGFLRG